MARIGLLLFLLLALNSTKALSQLHLKPKKDSLNKTLRCFVLPPNFYTMKMGYLCKKELQLQKRSSLPVFIRLGSKEYVDRLERKANSH